MKVSIKSIKRVSKDAEFASRVTCQRRS